MITSKISIVLFAFDNDETREQIKNTSFANEILLIVKDQNNEMEKLAKEYKAIVIHKTLNNKEQQSQAINIASNNWVLLLDKKEFISAELQKEILKEIKKPKTQSIYYSKQTLFFFGKTIRYGAFYKRKKILMVDKNRTSKDNFLSPTKSTTFRNKINSKAYQSFEDYNEILHNSRKNEAQILFDNKIKPNFSHFFLKPFFCFIDQYFIKLGFIDGREGFILAYINSFSILKRYLMLWLLHHNME